MKNPLDFYAGRWWIWSSDCIQKSAFFDASVLKILMVNLVFIHFRIFFFNVLFYTVSDFFLSFQLNFSKKILKTDKLNPIVVK